MHVATKHARRTICLKSKHMIRGDLRGCESVRKKPSSAEVFSNEVDMQNRAVLEAGRFACFLVITMRSKERDSVKKPAYLSSIVSSDNFHS